jgi:hypothetical protein
MEFSAGTINGKSVTEDDIDHGLAVERFQPKPGQTSTLETKFPGRK